jgi:hypothetical protein
MTPMNDAEKKHFGVEWDAVVRKIKASKYDLSKIYLMPVSVEYKKDKRGS